MEKDSLSTESQCPEAEHTEHSTPVKDGKKYTAAFKINMTKFTVLQKNSFTKSFALFKTLTLEGINAQNCFLISFLETSFNMVRNFLKNVKCNILSQVG